MELLSGSQDLYNRISLRMTHAPFSCFGTVLQHRQAHLLAAALSLLFSQDNDEVIEALRVILASLWNHSNQTSGGDWTTAPS